MLLYNTTRVAKSSNNKSFFNVARYNATDKALDHFKNACALMYIANNTSNNDTRYTANAELVVAQRKIDFWQRQANFDMRAYCANTSKMRAYAVVIAKAYMQ